MLELDFKFCIMVLITVLITVRLLKHINFLTLLTKYFLYYIMFSSDFWNTDTYLSGLQQIYLQFYFDLYKFIFCLFSSDTLKVLMFVCPNISEPRFYGCCHPCYLCNCDFNKVIDDFKIPKP